MDNQKRTRTRDDDVPIIGDYSEAQHARLRAETRDARAPVPASRAAEPSATELTAPAAAHPASGRPVHSGRSDAWRLDPSDVARHAQLRRRTGQRGALGKAVRYFAVVLALAGAFAVYWNFDTLQRVTIESPALSALLKSVSPDASVRANSAPDSAVVESSPVVGTAAPTSVSTAHDREGSAEVAKVEAHAQATPKSREAPAKETAPTSESPSAPESASPAQSVTTAPAFEPPAPLPETIGFALPKVTVSERDASAAVLIVRSGGNRGPSAFTWWTSDGTAKAGSDYVDLGKVVVKFAAGEQNRAIHIPIVGDGVVEGPESFYVNVALGDDAAAEPQDRVEVVIEDDDER